MNYTFENIAEYEKKILELKARRLYNEKRIQNKKEGI